MPPRVYYNLSEIKRNCYLLMLVEECICVAAGSVEA